MLTLNEAAAALGIQPAVLRRQIAKGVIEASKIGPIWTVTPEEVARYRAERLGRHGPRPKAATGA